MAVAFDNTAFISGGGIASLTTGAFTIAGANRAGILGLSVTVNSISAITADIGGVSGSPISGTDSGTAATTRSLMFGVTAPPIGSQAGTMSWTTNAIATLGVVTATGVDQATPFNGGTFATAAATPLAVSITSTNGDLTIDNAGVMNAALSAPTQTQRWNDTASNYGAGSTGPGTGTAVHSWTMSISETDPISGANFVQAAGGGGGTALEESEYFVMQAQTNPLTISKW